MRDNDSFYDIFFIFHPADIDRVGRIAAQIGATGISALLPEDEIGKSADGIKPLKNGILRSYTVAFVMSPDSAESQLCNELLQYAVSKGKPLVTLILDDEIEVEVHPSIAQNPYVFFREDDELAARVDELRAYLRSDDHLKRHTELLVRAENWRDRGRPPDLLLPPDKLDETREWLATASARHPKPVALQLEYVHSSRRQPPRRGPPGRPLPILAGIAAVIALVAMLLLLQRGVASWQAQRVAGAQLYEAQTQAAAQATAASDSAVGLIDQVAATGAAVRTAVAQNATVESITATAIARFTQTAQARSDMRATQLRITEIAALEKDDVARPLVLAGEEALAGGDIDLALALAWEAKAGLDNPASAYRLLRRAAAARRAVTIGDVSLLRIHPAGEVFALVPGSRDALRIYDGDSWSRLHEWTDHVGEITSLVYGDRLISASDDGAIIVRDGLTGTAEQRLNNHRDAVTALALAPDGRTLYSAGRDRLVIAWDIESGAELAAYRADEESDMEIHDLLVTADGERVIGWYKSYGRELMAQWSAPQLDLLSVDSDGRVYGGVDAQGRIGYSGGGSLPAYPGDSNTGDLILWDLSSGGQIARLTDGFNWSFLSGDGLAATDDLRFVAFFENLALAVAENSEEGQRANLVHAADGRLLRRLEGEIAANVTTATFIDEETILSATSDNRVLLWSSADGRLIREIGLAPQSIESLQVDPAANLVIVSTADGAAHLWRFEVAAAEPLLTLENALPGASISPSGDAILLIEDKSLSLRDAASGETLVQLPADLVSLASANFAVYADGRLSVHEFETGAEVRGWDWAGQLLDLHLSADGEQLLASSATDELWLFRSGTDAPQQLAEAAARPSLVRFAPAGDTILSLHSELARLWDSELGLARAAFPLGTGDYADVQAAFSADGGSVIFYVQLEDGLAGLTIVELAENEARRQTYVDVQSAALASDGEQLSLVYRDGRIVVVSTNSGAIIHEIDAAASDARKLQYLPESKALVAAINSELILWDADAGAIDQVFAHRLTLVDFSISRDGQRILTADESGVLRLWQVESDQELLARVEADHKPRDLTCAERERYVAPPLCV